MKKTVMAAGLAASGLALLSACGQSVQPQLVALNYAIVPETFSDELTFKVLNNEPMTENERRIANDNVTLCNLTLNFSPDLAEPDVTVNGAPGAATFSVTISSSNPQNLTTTNPAGCAAIEDLDIQMGSASPVSLNMPVSTFKANFKVGGTTFTSTETTGERTFIFNSFNPSTFYATGDIQSKGVVRGGSTKLLVSGGFGVRPS